jgi:D-alanyl-D-alanine carboxypeptidase
MQSHFYFAVALNYISVTKASVGRSSMRNAMAITLVTFSIIVGAIVIAIVPFVILTPRPPKPPGMLDTVTKLDAYLGALTANATPPALDIVVMKNGSIVYSRAFGVADGPKRKAAKPDDVYHYWSVTKLFTATAVMQLVEDHKLSLNDPITKYLPEFRTTLTSGTAVDVTVRQLLDHTSGMQDLGLMDLIGWIHHLGDREINQVTLVGERMRRYQTLAAKPGTVGAYSNAGYTVLGAIVEVASGQRFEDFIRGRILQPCGMNSTDFTYRADLLASAAAGSHPLFHFYTPLLLAIHRDWFTAWVSKTTNNRMWLNPIYTDYTGPTGLIGTGEDLARFGQAFLDRGQGRSSPILKAQTFATMLDDGYGGNDGPDNDRMGLGWHWWNTAPVQFKGHGGDGPGFGAQLAIFPDREMIVVVLANDTLVDRVNLTNLIAGVFK